MAFDGYTVGQMWSPAASPATLETHDTTSPDRCSILARYSPTHGTTCANCQHVPGSFHFHTVGLASATNTAYGSCNTMIFLFWLAAASRQTVVHHRTPLNVAPRFGLLHPPHGRQNRSPSAFAASQGYKQIPVPVPPARECRCLGSRRDAILGELHEPNRHMCLCKERTGMKLTAGRRYHVHTCNP